MTTKITEAKIRQLLCGCLFSLALSTHAAVYTTNVTVGATIPDGNPIGYTSTINLSGISDTSISDVNVTLNISGGYNGDLYGYLVHDSGFAVLLNRVGKTSGNPAGYSDAGLIIKLDDAATTQGDIHLYQTVSGYATKILDGSSWQPDARNTNPLTVTDASTRNAELSSFNNLNPNGDWTLFFADMNGGHVSTLNSWTLEITAVPEPVNVALGCFAVFFVGFQFTRSWKSRRSDGAWRPI